MATRRSKKGLRRVPNTSREYRKIDTRKRKNHEQIIRFLPPQEPIDQDRIYVIDKLLDKRISSGKEEYLVSWKNYSEEYNTWESRDEIEKNALDLVKEFNGESNEEDQNLYCICKRKYQLNQGAMIQCFTCSNWYHFDCLGLNMEEVNSYAKYHCNDCRSIDPALENAIKPEKLTTHYGISLLMNSEERGHII